METSPSIAGEPILDGRYNLERRLGQKDLRVLRDVHRQVADILRRQTHLFFQFAIERLLRRFVMFDAALGELPSILAADTPGPQQFTSRIGQDDAHIGPKTIGVDHGGLALVVILVGLLFHSCSVAAIWPQPRFCAHSDIYSTTDKSLFEYLWSLL